MPIRKLVMQAAAAASLDQERQAAPAPVIVAPGPAIAPRTKRPAARKATAQRKR